MQYLNFVYEGDGEQLHSGPVPESDASYLQKAATHLRPLSDEDYMTGPGAIVNSMAKYSYVLDGDVLFWCIEWEPGLLVVRMSPAATMQWVALRSPVPNFGGRKPLPEDGDPDAYGDDGNPQYNLIFTPWDAQFEKQEREWGGFVPADSDTQSRFESALSHVNELGGTMQSRFADDTESWFELSKRNIEEWAGEGVRLKTPN